MLLSSPKAFYNIFQDSFNNILSQQLTRERSYIYVHKLQNISRLPCHMSYTSSDTRLSSHCG